MANHTAIHAVGNGLIRFLRNTYPDALREGGFPCDFRLFSSKELTDTDNLGTTLSLFLYRITVNEFMRNARPEHNPRQRTVPLTVDLHYLLTVWADNAELEQTILGWAMRQFYLYPMLDTATFAPEAWDSEDLVQIVPAELSHEDLLRVWDALAPAYRLSFPYVARAIRLDPDQTPAALPVVDARLSPARHEPRTGA